MTPGATCLLSGAEQCIRHAHPRPCCGLQLVACWVLTAAFGRSQCWTDCRRSSWRLTGRWTVQRRGSNLVRCLEKKCCRPAFSSTGMGSRGCLVPGFRCAPELRCAAGWQAQVRAAWPQACAVGCPLAFAANLGCWAIAGMAASGCQASSRVLNVALACPVHHGRWLAQSLCIASG